MFAQTKIQVNTFMVFAANTNSNSIMYLAKIIDENPTKAYIASLESDPLLIKVDTIEAAINNNYFIDKIKECEQKLN